MSITLGILGADGRMGAAVINAISDRGDVHLGAAITAPNATALGQDAGTVAGLSPLGVTLTADIKAALDHCDVLIDFSAPKAAIQAAAILSGAEPSGRCKAMVSGTTGFTADENETFDAMSKDIALLRAGNFSPGVTALSVLVELAAEKLGTGWDIEVLEMHHRHKVDAPSGTALLLGEAAAKGRGVELAEKQVLSRVVLANEREMITLSHDAFDRSVFARGAVSAAVWTATQKSGLYTMRDVLGF